MRGAPNMRRAKADVLGPAKLKWVIVAIVAALALTAIVVQAASALTHPITHGSSSWSPTETDRCPDFEPGDDTDRCSLVAFEPGGRVDLGFSLRNAGSVPITVREIESFGADSEIMLARLDPYLTPEGEMYGLEGLRPFEAFNLNPDEEATLQLSGNMRSCEETLGHWAPGTGVVVDHVNVTAQWGLITRTVEIPLKSSLQISAPTAADC